MYLCKTVKHLQKLGTLSSPQWLVLGLEFILLLTCVDSAMQFDLVCPQLLQGASRHSTGCSCWPGRHCPTLHPLVANEKIAVWFPIQLGSGAGLGSRPSPVTHHTICTIVQ